MLKVLSIDVDFITDKYADKIILNLPSKEAHMKWWFFYKKKEHCKDPNLLKPNYENLIYLLDVFNASLKKDAKVMFAINHHSILLELDKIDEKMDIINIDHHHDILYGYSDKADVEKFNTCHCGTWVWKLHYDNKINSYTWIRNKNSSTYDDGITNSELPNNYKSYLKDELPFNLKDIDFDFIFVCLSPDYILPDHWVYFHTLRHMYEQKIGKEVQYIQNKPEININHLDFSKYKDVDVD